MNIILTASPKGDRSVNAHPVSPNTVLANALTSAEDALRPHILSQQPERIAFVVGTLINGAPHIGTSLVQSLTFAAADRVRERFGRPVEVVFSALDNAPYEIVTDPVTGNRYQRAYAQALGAQAINEQIATLYEPLEDHFHDMARRRVPQEGGADRDPAGPQLSAHERPNSPIRMGIPRPELLVVAPSRIGSHRGRHRNGLGGL